MNNDLYELFFHSSNEGLALLDSERKFKLINESFASIVGYTPEELIGNGFEILVPDKVKLKHKEYAQKYNEHPTQRSMGENSALYAQHKNGKNIPVEISLNPIHVEGEDCLALIVSNVSERAKAQEALKELNTNLEQKVFEKTKDLEEALMKEQELGELKSRFVSMVSHEFRTPLTTIKSSAQLIRKYLGSPDEKLDKHLGKIHRNIEHLNQMLNDVLTLSKLNESANHTDKSFFNLELFVLDCAEELEHLAKDKNIQLYCQHKGETSIFSDPKLLKSILLNLLTNAIKYSYPKGTVKVISFADKTHFKLNVTDNGIGISEKDKGHIFDRFYRAKEVENIEGTGLGLEIVKQCLDTLNGEISFQSEAENGSIFTIKVPHAS